MLVEIVIFLYLLAFDAPVRGEVPVGVLPPRLMRKNYNDLAPDGEKTLMTCLEYRRVTDGRTDRWTDRHLATS